MTGVLKAVFLFLHFAGIAGLGVGIAAAMAKRLVQARGAVWHSSVLMLFSGIGLVVVDSMAKDDVNHGKVGIKFFGQLILDSLNRTENAMSQAHAFKAAELGVKAQMAAKKIA